MKYTIVINQVACINSGLDLDLIDLAVLDFIKDFSASQKCIKTNTPEGVYFWVSHQLIIDSMPLLKIKTRNGMLKRIDNLVNAGVILKHPNSKALGRTYYSFGKNYDLLTFKGVQREFQPNDESMQPLHTLVSTPPDESIQYNNINYNNNSYNSNIPSNEVFGEFTEADMELFPDKQPEEEEQRKVAPKESKFLFRNSKLYKMCDPENGNYTEFEKLFTSPEFQQIDLIYYFNSVNDWSEARTVKRTDRGWMSTIKQFIRSDSDKKKLKLKLEYQAPSQAFDVDAAKRFLNDDF